MLNKNVNVDSVERLKSLRGKTMLECLEECEKMESCHYVQQESTTECTLYDKKAYFHIETQEEASKWLYERQIYSKKEYPGYKLSQHYKSVTGVENSDTCWEECLKERECEAISYNYVGSVCFLFAVGQYILENENDQNFTSITFGKVLFQKDMTITKSISSTKTLFFYENTQINGYFKGLYTSSLDFCWKECLQTNECVAISYSENKCFLFRKGAYEKFHFNNWISISKESFDDMFKLNDHLYFTQMR